MGVPIGEVVEKWAELGSWWLASVSTKAKDLLDPPGDDYPAAHLGAAALLVEAQVNLVWTAFSTVAWLTTPTDAIVQWPQHTPASDVARILKLDGPLVGWDHKGQIAVADVILAPSELAGKVAPAPPAPPGPPVPGETAFTVKVRKAGNTSDVYVGKVSVIDKATGAALATVDVNVNV
jgi:hypothetical protein